MAGSVSNTGSGASKLRLVADLATSYKDLNKVLQETKKLTESIATNIKSASNKGGSNPGDSMKFEHSTNGSDSAAGGGGGGGGAPSPNNFVGAKGGTMGASMKFAALSVGNAINAGTNASAYIENDISRRRYGFYNGVGGDAGAAMGSAMFNRTMRNGTATDPLDAARAAMMGTQSGIGGAGGMASAATMSNLVPGTGIAGSMQALNALNSARSVNMARMIGINIRDDKTGMMRSFTDIANQIWDNVIIKGYRGRGKPTAAEIQLSLQPGNALANLLDTYFGNDPILI